VAIRIVNLFGEFRHPGHDRLHERSRTGKVSAEIRKQVLDVANEMLDGSAHSEVVGSDQQGHGIRLEVDDRIHACDDLVGRIAADAEIVGIALRKPCCPVTPRSDAVTQKNDTLHPDSGR
jgi:hypothetical protein